VKYRFCATSRKVVNSILDGVFEVSHWLNPSSHTIALGVDSTSNRNAFMVSSLGGKGGRSVGLTTLPSSSAEGLKILQVLTFWSPWASTEIALLLQNWLRKWQCVIKNGVEWRTLKNLTGKP
jgi:hypothetical protein